MAIVPDSEFSLTVPDAATILGISQEGVRTAIRRRQLPARSIWHQGRYVWRMRRGDIAAYGDEHPREERPAS